MDERDGPGGSVVDGRSVALVHDFLLDLRGAERAFAAICDAWPEADIFTAIYDEVGTEGRFAHRNINTSFLQRLRPTSRNFRSLLPLYPYAVENLDLRGYKVVISSSSAWAHGVLVDPDAIHVCYCYNPFRYAWNAREETLQNHSTLVRAGLGHIFNRWRQWDWIAAQRVDRYTAISRTTQARIKRYFKRDADILYPPVETSRFKPGEVGDYFMVLSELMPHKRINVAVEAFTRLGLPLKIVGDGPEWRRLRRFAGPNIEFTGRIPDDEVADLLGGARALVVTATEEFGIAAIEAQASGAPVIALGAGGVLETVVDGVTGTFYREDSASSLVAAVQAFDGQTFDRQACVENAARFDVSRFQDELRRTVERAAAPERPMRIEHRLVTRRRGAARRSRNSL